MAIFLQSLGRLSASYKVNPNSDFKINLLGQKERKRINKQANKTTDK